MSFVNLMANDVWSESDIVAYMENMIRSYCSMNEEMILHRKMLGASVGQYTISAAENAEILEYAGVCKAAQDAGRSARTDMALLTQTMAYEQAQARLALPALPQPVAPAPDPNAPPGTPAPQVDPVAEAAYTLDQQQRATAQATVTATPPAAVTLAAQRASNQQPQA